MPLPVPIVLKHWKLPRGYGSYLLREVLRQNGGFDRTAPSEFTAPLPDADNTAAQALAAKFGFVPRGGLLVRRRG